MSGQGVLMGDSVRRARTLRPWELSLFAGIGVLDVLLYATGVILAGWYGPLAIAWSVAAAAFTTFFGVLALAQYSTGTPIDDRSMRHAVASSFVVTYFGVVLTIFFTTISPEASFAKELLSNFTALMVTVVAFYLGTTAVVDVVEIREQGKTARARAVQAGASSSDTPSTS